MSVCGQLPDSLLWATQSPYAGHSVTYIETRNGYDMYYLSAQAMYVVLKTYDCSWDGQAHPDLTAFRQIVDAFPPGDTGGVEDVWVIVDIYQGIEIQQFTTTNEWKYVVLGLTYFRSNFWTLEDCKTDIDTIMGAPPECPDGQVWDPGLGECVVQQKSAVLPALGIMGLGAGLIYWINRGK